MSPAELVRQQLQALPSGGIITSKELHQLSADNQQVNKAASRLYKSEGIQRLRNGLYYKPYCSKYFGELPPREEVIIRSIEKQYNAIIAPSGALAAYELGLTHTLPDTITYETDKRLSRITIENNTIYFRKVNSKKLTPTNGSLLSILKALEFLYKQDKPLSLLQEKRILNKIKKDFQKKERKKKKSNFLFSFFKIMKFGQKQNHEIAGITNCEITKCEDPLYILYMSSGE